MNWRKYELEYSTDDPPEQDELADASVYTNSVDKDELVFIVDFAFW